MHNFMFLSITVLLFAYYYLIKSWIFQQIPHCHLLLRYFSSKPMSIKLGAYELLFASLSHGFFVILLFKTFSLSLSPLLFYCDLSTFIAAVLIGFSTYGLSIIVCRLMIAFLSLSSHPTIPQSTQEWTRLSRAGWIRHHLDALICFPKWFACLLIINQLACEEMIFRFIVPLILSQYGSLTAMIIASLYFIFMQRFHMPSWIAALFPMVGALIMTIVHSLLIFHTPLILPLIISHFSFFIFSIIRA